MITQEFGIERSAPPWAVRDSGGSLQGRVNSFNQPNQANAYGTPDYLAPEILLGTSEVEQGGSVDWWSLGAMAYEFITVRQSNLPTSQTDPLSTASAFKLVRETSSRMTS